MDTVKIAVRKVQILKQIESSINHIRLHQLNMHRGKVTSDDPYHKLFYYDGTNGKFHIHFGPKYKTVPPVMITFHASKFTSYRALDSDLMFIFGRRDWLNSCRISRLDCCVDLDVEYEPVFQSITQPRVVKVKEIHGKRRTLYLGSKPKLTTVYQKKFDDDDDELESGYDDDKLETHCAAFDSRQHSDCNNKFKTRVEVRHFRGHKKVQVWGDVWKLHFVNPFDHLMLKAPDYDLLQSMTRKKRQSLQCYLFEVDFFGAEMAKKNFGKHWGERVKPFLKTPNLNLHKEFIAQMKLFGLPRTEFKERSGL